MKKILSTALSVALLINTFATLTIAENFEMVENTATGYEDTYQEMPENQISHYNITTGMLHSGWSEQNLSGYGSTTKKMTRTSDLTKDDAGWQLSPFYLEPKSESQQAMTEYWLENGNYVMSVNVKDDSPAGMNPAKFNMYFGYYAFRNYTDTYPSAQNSMQLTKEFQKFAGSFTIPQDSKSKTKKFVAGIPVSGGIPNGQSFIASDFYIAKEVAYDIEISGNSQLEAGKSAEFSAKVVNQVGTGYSKATKAFSWYVVDSERTATVDGFTVTPNAGDSSKVTISFDKKKVEPGKYALVAKSDNIVKGLEIVVPKEVLYDNGTITLEIASGDILPSYDVFSKFTITAGNIEAGDINWYAVRANRMDTEDKITITPTTDKSAKVSFLDGIEDGTYYIVAESLKDSSKRKMQEILVDNSNIKKTIISDFNSGDTSEWAENLDRYVATIGEDTDLFKKADKTEILNLIAQQSKVEAFTEENLSKLFKGIVILSLYNKNPNGVTLNDENGLFNFETDLDLASIDENGVTIYNLYKTLMTDEGKNKVLAELTGKGILTVAEFKEIFAESTILNAINYPNVLGFQYVKSILTAENMAYVSLDAGKYLSPKDGDNSGYNKEIARKTLTKAQLEAILAMDIEGVPEDEIYQPSEGEKTEIEIPMGTEGVGTTIKAFTDVPDSHWAYADIYFLTELGVISGVTEDLFAPDNLVTREVAAKMICLAFNLQATGDAKNFTDVDPNAWYAESIKIASAAGVINGISDDKFGVGMPVTRQDLCVMITRASKASLSDVESLDFEDSDKISDYAKKSVSYLSILSIISGYDDNTFRPDGYCKRSEIARIISRTLNTIDMSSGDADQELVYSATEELLFGIGAVDTEKYLKNSQLSRAELARFINDVCIREEHDVDKEWETNVTVDDKLNSPHRLFDDVDKSHPEYYDIDAVTTKGYMDGISERLFAPDIQVNLNYVVKTVLDIMGYDEIASISGGYSEGYIELARSLDLLDGVYGEMEAPAKYKDVVRVFANALETGVNKVGSIKGNTVVLSSKSDKTFMTEIMKVDVIEGLLTDNGITSLTGKSKVSRDTVVIGGHEIEVPEGLEKCADMIGKRVRAYYDCSDDSKKVLVYMAESSNNDYFAFDLRDFLSFDGTTLSYEVNGIEKNLTVSNPTVIYNGTIIETYDESLFVDKYGDVTVLSVYEKNDYIIVNEYKDFYASKVSPETEKIYSSISYQKGDELKILNLKAGEDFEDVNIYFSTGEAAKFADIQADLVLAVKLNEESGIIDVYIHKEAIYNTMVTSVDEDGVTVAEGTFEIAPSYKNSGLTLTAGKSYNLYLNQFGDIVYSETVEITDGRQMGILTRPINNDDEEIYGTKIYDSNKAIVLYSYAERVTVNGERKKKQDVNAFIESAVGNPVIFTVTDGLITEITTPESVSGTDNDRGWFKIIEPVDKYGHPVVASEADMPSEWESAGWSQYRYANFYLYSNAAGGRSFGARFGYEPGKTQVYVVPANSDDYSNPEKFSINTKNFSNDTLYMVEAYAYSKNAVIPDVIVAREEAVKTGNVDQLSCFLVTGVSQGLTANEEISDVLKGYKITDKEIVYAEMPLSDDVIFIGQFKDGDEIQIGGTSKITIDDNISTSYTVNNHVGNIGPRNMDELAVGDIIRYALDGDGNIATIAVSYDKYIDDKEYEANNGYSQNFRVRSGEADAFYGYVMNADDDGIKILSKYIKSISSSNVTLTKGNTPEKTDLKTFEGYSRMYGFTPTASFKVLFVEETGAGKVSAWIGSVDDIISYEDSGSGYDEIVLLTRNKDYHFAAVVYR